jgi:hypothetical protein
MERRTLEIVAFALPLTLLALSGCGDDMVGATGAFTTANSSESVGGDGDGDSASETAGNSAEGDGDGDGDGDGEPGDGDGDGDGDGEPGDGDGDGDGDPPCADDADCVDVGNPVCDLDTGECVPCTPANDPCEVGQYCDETNTCVIGCLEDLDCPNDLLCDVVNMQCTGCVLDMNCPVGSVCDAGNCVPGCTDEQPCQNGFSCCGGDCENLVDDPNNCGDCGMVCPDYPNADEVCNGGICGLGPCTGSWNDCNGDPVDGCETQAMCLCVPGEEIDCYTGFPANTENVGECQSGTRTCNAMGTSYGACVGQITPQLEVCGSGLDENCNGMTDENPDLDGDGWGVCDNDCCDQVSPDCSTPDLVNPGAFEFGGNMVDDNCDGQVDNVLALCDGNLAVDNGNALDHARALDLCQFTTENPALPQKKWGVISGGVLRGNGTGTPFPRARSIRPQFGNVITPQLGQRLSVFSSGTASYPGAPNPAWAAFQNGLNQDFNNNVFLNDSLYDVQAPADWVQANGGAFPMAPGCPEAPNTIARDSIMLKLRVRVPTNANSFSARMYFASAEYPEWVCGLYNDLFITLVDSSDNGNPADKNIAVYTQGNNEWPVGVNLVSAAPGLFEQCTDGAIGQCNLLNQNYNGCTANNELNGTGFETNAVSDYCPPQSSQIGGGTGWLIMSGNVTPGETMEIRFVIWDTTDSLFDSVVLLDRWEWSVQAALPGVTPG